LSAKIQADGEKEDAAFQAYSDWCREASDNTGFEIKTATSRKEKLEAKINELTANIAANDGHIDDLSAAIATADKDLAQATEVRARESADFAAAESELVEGIDTLSRASTVISREMAKNPAAFAQLDTSNIQKVLSAMQTIFDAASFSTVDQKKLLAFVQSREDADDSDWAVNAPAAAVYKSHSGGILDALEDLKEKAEADLAALRKAETNTQHNFDMLKQSLTDQSEADTKDLNNEKSNKASNNEGKAAAEGNLHQTNGDLKAAKKTLASVTENCGTVKADHEATVAARNEELKVIADAVDILKKSTGGAVKQTYSFIQTSSTMKSKADLANNEVLVMIKKLANDHHSSALAQLASRISAIVKYGTGTEDPFAKVKGLISDMIARLEAEADAAATEKAYCDEQMARTELKRDELNAAIAKLTSKIDQASAKSADLKAQVKEDQGELAELAKQQAEMDAIRRQQNDDFIQAKADLEQGLAGVRKALGVLREYYGGSAFVQQPEPPKPELFHASGGAANSIIGILEVVESDFAANLVKEETTEADALAAYEKQTQENAVLRTMKEQDVKYNTAEAVRQDKAVAEMTSDRGTHNTELDAVLEFYGKLRERCVAKPETYEVRKQRREAEIAGLKEALNILENEAAFIQRKRRGSIRGAVMP